MLDSPLFKKLAEKDPIKRGLSVIIGFHLYRLRGPMLLLKRSPTFEFGIKAIYTDFIYSYLSVTSNLYQSQRRNYSSAYKKGRTNKIN